MIVALSPTALLRWLLAHPARNQPWVIRHVRGDDEGARAWVVVAFGIGMHTGDVILGAIGLPERSQYDAIGDAVNTASGMETLTKEFRVEAVLSGETAARLRDDGVALRPLGEAVVKGKADAIEVFTLA
jgi:class 3 adenylate cyclase